MSQSGIEETAKERAALFWRLYGAREKLASLIFVQRRLQRTWVHARQWYYFADGSWLLSVEGFWERSFLQCVSNLVPLYRARKVDPRTRFMERAVYRQRLQQFELESVSRARPSEWLRHAYAEQQLDPLRFPMLARVDPELIRGLERECVRQEFFWARTGALSASRLTV